MNQVDIDILIGYIKRADYLGAIGFLDKFRGSQAAWIFNQARRQWNGCGFDKGKMTRFLDAWAS